MTVKGEKRKYSVKERNTSKLFKFLADLDNEWPLRRRYSVDILGYKNEQQMYRSLSPDDITAIESDAMQAIKSQSSRQRKEIYESLYKEGKSGDVSAAKEFLDRTEGKVPNNINANLAGDLTIELVNFCESEDKE